MSSAAMLKKLLAKSVRGSAKRRLGIAVSDTIGTHNVRRKLPANQGSAGNRRFARIGHGSKNVVPPFDQSCRVFRNVAVLRHDQSDSFADKRGFAICQSVWPKIFAGF